MNWLPSFSIAHRGLHSNNSEIPENSLKAFSRAIDSKYAIELDIRLSKDLQLVVFHDDDLKRMCNKEGAVESYDLKSLQSFKLLNSGEKIPILKDVFNLVEGKVPILIEIKSNSKKVGIIESILLDELKKYTGQIAVQSFNPFSVRWFKQNAPDILRGQLSSSFKNEKMSFVQRYILKYMLLNFLTKPNFIAYEKDDIRKSFLQKKKRQGIVLLCWTIKSLTEQKQISNFCNSIIFEGFTPKLYKNDK